MHRHGDHKHGNHIQSQILMINHILFSTMIQLITEYDYILQECYISILYQSPLVGVLLYWHMRAIYQLQSINKLHNDTNSITYFMESAMFWHNNDINSVDLLPMHSWKIMAHEIVKHRSIQNERERELIYQVLI